MSEHTGGGIAEEVQIADKCAAPYLYFWLISIADRPLLVSPLADRILMIIADAGPDRGLNSFILSFSPPLAD
jgi:hypothetical protein